MKVDIEPAPWVVKPPSAELREAVALLAAGVWRDAAYRFRRDMEEKKKLLEEHFSKK